MSNRFWEAGPGAGLFEQNQATKFFKNSILRMINRGFFVFHFAKADRCHALNLGNTITGLESAICRCRKHEQTTTFRAGQVEVG